MLLYYNIELVPSNCKINNMNSLPLYHFNSDISKDKVIRKKI